MAELHFESRMSDSDALMWNIEKDPLLRSTITVVTLLDREPDRDAVADKIERGSRLVPRMRQRVIGNAFSLAPPRWEYDPNFDLRYHVRWMNAGGAGTIRTVLDIAEPMAMQGFDRARPLWEFAIVTGLEGGRAAMVQKLHHAITDGVGGMQIAMLLLDLERDAATDDSPMPPLPDGHVMSPGERTMDALTHIARRNMGIARRATSTLGGAAVGAAADPLGVIRGVGEAVVVGRAHARTRHRAAESGHERPLPVGPLRDHDHAARRAEGGGEEGRRPAQRRLRGRRGRRPAPLPPRTTAPGSRPCA